MWVKSKKDSTSTRERLDGFLVNPIFIDCVNSQKVSHQNYYSSDHRSILIEFFWKSSSKFKRPSSKTFKFEESWLKADGCKEAVDKAWGSHLSVDIQY